MTISQAKLTKESFPIGNRFDTPISTRGNIISIEVSAAKPLPIANTSSIDDFINEFETDPEMSTAMANARHELATILYNDNPVTFSAIRLSAGLSQEQLADKASTSQSHIAKIESGKNDPGTDVIAKIASALNQDESIVFAAIRNQRKMRESQE